MVMPRIDSGRSSSLEVSDITGFLMVLLEEMMMVVIIGIKRSNPLSLDIASGLTNICFLVRDDELH